MPTLKTATLRIDVAFDEEVTDAESLAAAADQLLENALSTPGILDEYSNPRFDKFFVLTDKPLISIVEAVDGESYNLGAVQLLKGDYTPVIAALIDAAWREFQETQPTADYEFIQYLAKNQPTLFAQGSDQSHHSVS